VLDHRTTSDVGENFCWTTRRMVPGGNDNDGVQ
jgi:hypothetical protein